MPDLKSSQTDNTAIEPPPSGDPKKADRYVSQLIELIDTDKLLVSHTDLARFDPTSLQDHYRLDLKDYEVEVSHTKQPDSGKDFYIILFNNLKYISQQCTEKIILAYIHLSESQFKNFKSAADKQLEKIKKAEEEKRFKEAMSPIDEILDELATPALSSTETTPVIPIRS